MNDKHKLRQLGAVTVIAEGGNLVTRTQNFLLHIVVSASLEIDDEEAKAMASEIICATKWGKAIVSMLEGQRALLPTSKSGVYRVVQRLKDAAALVITDFKPGYEMDWSDGDRPDFARQAQ